MRTTIKTLGKLPVVEPPPEVREPLLRRFSDWKG